LRLVPSSRISVNDTVDVVCDQQFYDPRGEHHHRQTGIERRPLLGGFVDGH
jgi:hypothetical protein